MDQLESSGAEAMGQPLGVGIIGAGLATRAIHLPTLAKLGGRFRVVRIADVEASTVTNVAARCGATASGRVEEIYADPTVDVVAICSPNAFHAEQAIAACRAGKRLILVEKPLAASRAEGLEVARVAKETGSSIVVGAMHVYDPAYRAARAAWSETHDDARHIHSAIFLPNNNHFIDQATDRVPAPPSSGHPALDFEATEVQALMLRTAILGLAIHDLPLIRSFVPAVGTIHSARFVTGFGYEISFIEEERSVRLLALMPGGWTPHWTLRAVGAMHELIATFPPSYVLAGSSRCEVIAPDRTISFEQRESGYEAMWRHIHALVVGDQAPISAVDEIVADFDYALDLADQVDAFLGVK